MRAQQHSTSTTLRNVTVNTHWHLTKKHSKPLTIAGPGLTSEPGSKSQCRGREHSARRRRTHSPHTAGGTGAEERARRLGGGASGGFFFGSLRRGPPGFPLSSRLWSFVRSSIFPFSAIRHGGERRRVGREGWRRSSRRDEGAPSPGNLAEGVTPKGPI